MIEINLLPLELRQIKRNHLYKLPNSKQVLFIAGLALLSPFLIYIFTMLAGLRVHKLNEELLALTPQRQELNQLKSDLAKAKGNIPLFEQFMSRRILWSNKLNKLSDYLIPGVWFTELSLDDEYLIIRASVASKAKDEPSLIGRFMQNLKGDALFSAEFSEIALGQLKKRLIAQTEVMDFIFNCPLKRKD